MEAILQLTQLLNYQWKCILLIKIVTVPVQSHMIKYLIRFIKYQNLKHYIYFMFQCWEISKVLTGYSASQQTSIDLQAHVQ